MMREEDRADLDAADHDNDDADTSDGVQTTLPRPRRDPPQQSTFNRAWLIRVVVMFIALAAFGAWGLFDATVAYPSRGERYADYAEYEYLQALKRADEMEQPGLFPAEAGVEDPVAELERLNDPETQERNAADAVSESGRSARAQMQVSRRTWLVALSRIGRLDPAFTTYEGGNSEVRERLAELEQRWTVESPPSPLAYWDITMQWVIVAVCWGFAAYIGVLFIRVGMTKYTWDPVEQRLRLPGGKTFVPADMADVDKRKWDKFLVFVTLNESHPDLGGSTIRFDTFRHARLEDWLLTMEATAFPDAADPDAEVGANAPGEPAEAEADPAAR